MSIWEGYPLRIDINDLEIVNLMGSEFTGEDIVALIVMTADHGGWIDEDLDDVSLAVLEKCRVLWNTFELERSLDTDVETC